MVAWTVLALGLCPGFLPAPRAEGFRNPPAGAFNLGRAGGRIAQVDDPSAATQNPANLVDLAHPMFSFAPTFVYMKVNYDSPNHTAATTTDPWKILPNLFVSVPLQTDRLALGLGVTVPYGLSTEWELSGSFTDPTGLRYQTPYFAELKTININPALAVRLVPRLTLGAGLDVMWSQLSLRQFYPWAMVVTNPSAPDGVAHAKAEGTGLGGNAGLTWQITDRQRLALTYRSSMEVDYSGAFDLDRVPAALGGGVWHSDFDSAIRFPTIVALGYGLQVSPAVRLEADVEWLEFSRFDQLPIDLRNRPPGLPAAVQENWKNTFTAGIGGDWRFAPNWFLRSSYQFYESPVPNETFTPIIPDANQNVFTIGLGYRQGHHGVEIAFGEVFYDKRQIVQDQNPVLNGRYNIRVHLFAFAYHYSF